MGRMFNFCLVAVLLVGVYGDESSTSSVAPPPTNETPPTTTTTSTSTTDSTTSTSSTTSAPTTSTSTTPATSTTTIPASTTSSPVTTPAPVNDDQFYRVTEDNVTCIMFSGDVKFTVTYPQAGGKVNTTTVKVPKANDKTRPATSSGSCNGSEQYLLVEWGATNKNSNFRLTFNSTGLKWELVHTEANIYMDEATFVNASDIGQELTVMGEFPGLSYVAVDTNSSLTCRALTESSNFTGQVLNSSSKFVVAASAVGVEMQAYNSVPNTTNLQQGSRCEMDITSDLVPIAVGCALAGLVLLVLISYLVGRRRRSAAYQSV
ncbi:lysosome-associated membrane glycoprotein 1 [Hyalella azteca]|uniref:Lysosome-associated membrane glycoprotein 1 n=1 Tax=Hyalella azteca TaxID=294128 RepID=A0A8B7N3Z8_HYAAZ|nr:lysosome-associated membrane glycoprotein 1 [Hyalella azteca]